MAIAGAEEPEAADATRARNAVAHEETFSSDGMPTDPFLDVRALAKPLTETAESPERQEGARSFGTVAQEETEAVEVGLPPERKPHTAPDTILW